MLIYSCMFSGFADMTDVKASKKVQYPATGLLLTGKRKKKEEYVMNAKIVHKRWLAGLTAALVLLLLCSWGVDTQAKAAAKKMCLSRTRITAYKEMKRTRLKVKNLKKGKKVKWSSGNPKVAVVDEKGVITFLRTGNTIVTAKVGKKKFRCIVSVCSKKAYKAVEKAYKFYNARNMRYSQGSRMSRRAADCSSFCGRCYLPQGLTMGGSKSWCNTAAGMAKWATDHHKVVANGSVKISSLKLLPGDLVFYRRGYNGRYKNIYHVEIFVGYGWKGDRMVGYTMSSITGHYPSILKRDYASRQSRIAEISRPTRK